MSSDKDIAQKVLKEELANASDEKNAKIKGLNNLRNINKATRKNVVIENEKKIAIKQVLVSLETKILDPNVKNEVIEYFYKDINEYKKISRNSVEDQEIYLELFYEIKSCIFKEPYNKANGTDVIKAVNRVTKKVKRLNKM